MCGKLSLDSVWTLETHCLSDSHDSLSEVGGSLKSLKSFNS